MRHTLPASLFVLAALLVALLASDPSPALAHRVNIFAVPDGDGIRVQCGFSRSQPVRGGKVIVSDNESGAPLLEGLTDEHGVFRFHPGRDFLAGGHDLLLVIEIGDGHRNQRVMSAEELRTLPPQDTPGPAVLSASPAAADPVPAPANPANPSAPPGQPLPEALIQSPVRAGDSRPGLSEQPITSFSQEQVRELETIVGHALDARLAPLRLALERQSEPNLRDIIGGLGWILGLVGIVAYIRSRQDRV